MGRKKEVVFDEQPPDFDPANPYKDPVAMLEMREHLVSITSRSVVTLSSNTLIQLVVLDGVKMVVIQISTVLRFRAWSDLFFKVIGLYCGNACRNWREDTELPSPVWLKKKFLFVSC
ncbi:unnamed protein product [Lactuca virosa]|uniref:Uncharacterized protein n=1 Tax=Lactuca virosa TaxID=75947 RepID=A0AAU9NA13_9ASTR|nr:unnamed protein product [Lactuca virosa]